jgi:hypothetical protein
MSGLTDEMRRTMTAINANIGHTRAKKSGARYFRHDGERVVESDRPNVIVSHSMFPYRSVAMAVNPEDIPGVQEQLRRKGVLVDFDEQGRPEITSAKQQSDLAKALGMKTGRDGYGHTDEQGNFHNSGRRRADEIAEGRGRVRKAIEELETMPEDAPAGAVAGVLDEYDIFPNEENTG